MDTVLAPDKLLAVYADSATLVTRQTSGILLTQEPADPEGDVCTLYTVFDRSVHSGLALCAETRILTRLTQQMMCSEHVEPQDVEDFSKEFYNILCGHIAVGIFKLTKVAARFQIPVFIPGAYRPEGLQEDLRISFRSDQDEALQLIHYTPVAS